MLTPRPYLSWTQLDLFEKDPEGYREVYIRGGGKPENAFMKLGKEIADAMETGQETGNAMKDLVISMIPKFDDREVEISATIKMGKTEIPLFGKMDSGKKKTLDAFKEVKTGSVKWTQRRADEHGQITFYCTIIKEITKKIPEDIELVWAETVVDKGRPMLTGKIVILKTKRTLADIIKMKARMKKAWEGIQEMMAEELGL